MVKESVMVGKALALFSALALAFVPTGAGARSQSVGSPDARKDSLTQGRSETGGQSYGDRNRGGPYGFHSYPRHRHVDGGSGRTLDRRPSFVGSPGTSPYCDNCHGSAYYGRDYVAPYFGGGYYDQGVYYRERRER
jgi:hypothetical protein